MPHIEVRSLSGEVDKRELSKGHSLSIGSHDSNDVTIGESAVAAMHCRISWNKRDYEVVAANSDGVEVNGVLVQHASLKTGDVIRVGTFDVVLCDDPAEVVEQPAKSSEIDLKPITEDNLQKLTVLKESLPKAIAIEVTKTVRNMDSQTGEPQGKSEALADEGQSDWYLEEDSEHKEPTEPESVDEVPIVGSERQRALTGSMMDRLRDRMGSPAARPGEQEVLRSPMVVGLGVGVVLLVIAAATLTLTIGRQTSKGLYDRALQELGEGKYTQSIQTFEQFLEKYPNHRYAISARFGLGKARVLKEISGATPAWTRGLNSLQEFVQQNRDRSAFSKQHADVRTYAERIALGAAVAAEKSNDTVALRRDMLAIAVDAKKIVTRFPTDDQTLAEVLARIDRASDKAEREIRRQETFETGLQSIETAIAEKRPMAAFQERIHLIEFDSTFAKRPELIKLYEQTLETERALVTSDEKSRDAFSEERSTPTAKPLSLMLHTRSVTSDPSGRAVLAAAKNCCYGIDASNGEPIWRRVVGLDPPFFPIRVQTSIAGLLLFDTNHRELVLVEESNGQLFWRQPIEEMVTGPPLIHEGQIYLPTLGHHLYQIDLETGRVSSRLTFSQPVLSPPVLASGGDRMIVVGDESVLYTVSLRPMECVAVSYLGQRAGSIEAPPIRMGTLLLLSENIGLSRSRLIVVDTRDPSGQIAQIASSDVNGTIRDTPVLRGTQLFVTSEGGQISSFTVSDDRNETPLDSGPRFSSRTTYDGPTFLSVGADGELWMMSDALRKFEVTTNNIKPAQKQLAVGISSQPLQQLGDDLYLGRRLPFSDAVLFTRADRQEMVSQWRIVLGASVKGALASGANSIVCVTENGSVTRIVTREFERGGFKVNATTDLPLPKSLDAGFRATALSPRRLGVYTGGADARLWTLNTLGQIERQIRLESPLQTDPIELPVGIVLPMAGRLRLVSRQHTVDDYIMPVEETQPNWLHLAALDERQLLAIDSNSSLTKIQLRDMPQPHLARVASLELEQQVDVAPVVHEGRLLIADAEGGLVVLDAATLDTLSKHQLDAPASGPLRLVGDRLFVETGGKQLSCFELQGELKRLWQLPLEDAGLSGAPLIVNSFLVVTMRDGTVLGVDPETGTVRARMQLGQPLTHGALSVDQTVVVPSIDGSWHRVESVIRPVE